MDPNDMSLAVGYALSAGSVIGLITLVIATWGGRG